MGVDRFLLGLKVASLSLLHPMIAQVGQPSAWVKILGILAPIAMAVFPACDPRELICHSWVASSQVAQSSDVIVFTCFITIDNCK